MASSLQDLENKYKAWKEGMETKGLRVNTNKTKVMVSRRALMPQNKTGKYPCGVCWQGVGHNSILCTSCDCWVHKKCSGISGSLSAVRDFTCKRCCGLLPRQDDIPNTVTLNGDSLEVVQKFCYLGDMLDAGGGAQSSSITRVQCAWGKFRNLLPLLTSKAVPSKVKGELYRACVQTVMLYGSETWPVKVEDTQRLHRNEMLMIRWICRASPLDRDSCDLLRERLGVTPITELMRVRRLR